MQTTTHLAGPLPPGPVEPCFQHSLAQLSDSELLEGTRRLVGRSNALLAELLAHLAEVEARGIHRTRACSSLYAYCIYELRFSEDEAFRRVAAARLVRRFPALLDALASGELHLTGLLMLGPHLTEANLVEVVARAKYRTKRELARLVRILDPLPAVPARIEPLGPAPARLVPSEPTWQDFMDSTCPVRELTPGDRPCDWTESANGAILSCPERGGSTMGRHASAGATAGAGDSGVTVCAGADPDSGVSTGTSVNARARRDRQADAGDGVTPGAGATAGTGVGASRSMDGDKSTRTVDNREQTPIAAPARVEPTPWEALKSARYKVQFTATEEYVRLVDEAKALLSHAVPNVTLEEVQMRAMRVLVAELKKEKYAAGDVSDALVPPAARERREGTDAQHPADAPHPRQRGCHDSSVVPGSVEAFEEDADAPHPRQRGRHIPSAVRRRVFERDGARCTYVDANGTRCRETHRLEFHHLKPFAMGGDHCASNLTLRCAAHNALAAEEDFGRALMEARKGALLSHSYG